MWPFRKKSAVEELQERRLATFGPIAAVSSLCIGPARLPVMHAIRGRPTNVSDSGWILASGKESVEFEADVRNYELVPLESMVGDDATLAPLRSFPVGTEITRLEVAGPWRFIVDDKVVDENGREVGVCD